MQPRISATNNINKMSKLVSKLPEKTIKYEDYEGRF